MTAPLMKPIRHLLPARFFSYGEKEGVIAYLAACDLEPPQRRRYYRAWCSATNTKCRREDLARVAPGKPREVQLGLLG